MPMIYGGAAQHPRHNGHPGLKPLHISDFLNGLFSQMTLKCNKSTQQKIVPLLPPLLYLRLRRPYISIKKIWLNSPTKETHSVTMASRVLANFCSDTSCWYIPTPEIRKANTCWLSTDFVSAHYYSKVGENWQQ